jgi:hypothetical protein
MEPHRPQREYRYERDEQALADVRQQAKSWHHGMLGRRTCGELPGHLPAAISAR